MTDSVFAQDQDVGINMTLTYSLTSNQGNLFDIDPNNGEIRLKNIIQDYDKYEYNLIVKATQIDNPLRSALSTINIYIKDINNYAPKFDNDFYEANIYENSKIDKIVCIISATDKDKNRIEYSILNNHEQPFSIDKYKGIIRVNGRLDYEMKTKYKLDVIASDGNHTTNTTVQINVINLVDKAPYFEYNSYTFRIKIPYDVYIGQVRAIDVENTGDLNYSLVFDKKKLNYSKLFCITQTGILYLCSSIITNTMRSSQNDSPQSNNLEDLFNQYKQNEYTFNISVSIHSDSLMAYLESHVECKVNVEYKYDPDAKISSNSTSTLKPLNKFKSSPTLFLNEHLLFRDKNSVYALASVIIGTLILLFFCATATIWVRCRNRSTNINTKSPCSSSGSSGSKPAIKSSKFWIFSTSSSNKKLNSNSNSSSCSPSSRSTQNSCKDSTSGFSCLSSCSNNDLFGNKKISTNHSNHNTVSKKLNEKIYYLNWEEKLGENDIIYETGKFKQADINLCTLPNMETNSEDFDQIKVSNYFNILSSTASTLKNREGPIMFRKDGFLNNEMDSNNKNIDYLQVLTTNTLNRNSLVNMENDSNHSTFKSNCCLPNKQKHMIQQEKSPKLLTFSPPPPIGQSLINFKPNIYECSSNFIQGGGVVNLVFNRNEPLSVSSEINIDNDDEMFKSSENNNNRLSNCSGLPPPPPPTLQLTNESTTVSTNLNDTLTMSKKLDLMEQNCVYEFPNDSLVSISVDDVLGSCEKECKIENNEDEDDEENYNTYSQELTNVSNDNNENKNNNEVIYIYNTTSVSNGTNKFTKNINNNVKLHESNISNKTNNIVHSKPPLGFRDPIDLNKLNNNCLLTQRLKLRSTTNCNTFNSNNNNNNNNSNSFFLNDDILNETTTRETTNSFNSTSIYNLNTTTDPNYVNPTSDETFTNSKNRDLLKIASASSSNSSHIPNSTPTYKITIKNNTIKSYNKTSMDSTTNLSSSSNQTTSSSSSSSSESNYSLNNSPISTC